jgi:hypothetical protein
VGLAVFRESLVDLGVGRKAGCLQACLDHAQAAVWKDGAFERRVGLQADDHLVVAVDIAGLVRQQRRRRLRVDGEHAFLPLLLEIGLKLFPHTQGAPRRPDQKRLVTQIGRDVGRDEVAHVDRRAPGSGLERAPTALIPEILRKRSCSLHDILL